MVKDRYKKHILFTSAILAVVIFLAGIVLGWSLDHFRVNQLLYDIRSNELGSESYLVEQSFFENFVGSSCELASPRITFLSRELRELGQQLEKFEGQNIFKQPDFDYLKRKYFLLEIKTYTLFNKLKQECGSGVNTILFFYDIEDSVSQSQGFVLDKLVKITNSTVIFSFDREYENEPVLDTVKLHYNITKAPTLIINDKIKKEGFVSLVELKSILERRNGL